MNRDGEAVLAYRLSVAEAKLERAQERIREDQQWAAVCQRRNAELNADIARVRVYNEAVARVAEGRLARAARAARGVVASVECVGGLLCVDADAFDALAEMFADSSDEDE